MTTSLFGRSYVYFMRSKIYKIDNFQGHVLDGFEATSAWYSWVEYFRRDINFSCSVIVWIYMYTVNIERFKCRKRKTVAPANHNKSRQHNGPIWIEANTKTFFKNRVRQFRLPFLWWLATLASAKFSWTWNWVKHAFKKNTKSSAIMTRIYIAGAEGVHVPSASSFTFHLIV